MVMMAISAIGFLLSDGEKRRVRWVRAMRRCLLRMNGVIRYEQPELSVLLSRMDLRATPEERELTRLLHVCAAKLEAEDRSQLMMVFAAQSARLPGYGVLSEEDRSPFENIMAELGRTRLAEQIRLIDSADERLRVREDALSRECTRRVQLIRTLSASLGAAVFLILI